MMENVKKHSKRIVENLEDIAEVNTGFTKMYGGKALKKYKKEGKKSNYVSGFDWDMDLNKD